ncbi:MAG TPA: BLUF domain-containing protein, partial [Chthoniobacterales bacterium]|nr:BLUF domain-containing protein [Chthoniobacterales bacterium]
MFQIVYLSSGVREFSETDLQELLEDSRRRNELRGVTGALFHRERHFLQVIEGAESDVRRLYRSICADRRHRILQTLWVEQIAERSYPDWTMAFSNLDREAGRSVPDGFEPLMHRRGLTEH